MWCDVQREEHRIWVANTHFTSWPVAELSNSHFSWPQMKLTVPNHRAVRYMSWGCSWTPRTVSDVDRHPQAAPGFHTGSLKGNSTWLRDVILHVTKGSGIAFQKIFFNQSFTKKKKKPQTNKQKNQPLIRQKGWGNNTEEWSNLQEVLLLFLSPQIKTILHYVLMKWHKLLLCFVTWKQHTPQIIRRRPRKKDLPQGL